VTGTPPGRPAKFCERTQVGWHATFLGFTALVAVAGWLDVPSGRRLPLVVLVAVLLLAYGLAGVRALGGDRTAVGLAYLVPAWAAFFGLVALTDVAYLLLLVLFPQSWAMLATRRAAVTWNCLAVTGLLVAQLAAGAELGAALLVGVTNLAVTLLLGWWITGLVRESEQRAELIEQLTRTRADLAEVERARGVLAERERLAGEIHDTLAQGFTSVLTLAQAVEVALDRDPATARARLALLEATARDNLAEARALVAALGPVDLEGATLVEALQRVADRFRAQTGVAVRVEVEGAARRLTANAEVVLLRSAQEALANVGRHASARTVVLRLAVDEEGGQGRTTLEVVDDGSGFDASATAGFGLHGIRSRAAQVGGEAVVRSALGVGTTVRVSVP
jgi:signal transduction histidine kinase